MWLWPSIKSGITVLPVRSTRVAFAGGCRSPFLPTQVKESPSTRKAELSMVGLLSPAIRRAPSNHTAERRACEEDGEEDSMGKLAAARMTKQDSSRRNDMVSPREHDL